MPTPPLESPGGSHPSPSIVAPPVSSTCQLRPLRALELLSLEVERTPSRSTQFLRKRRPASPLPDQLEAAAPGRRGQNAVGGAWTRRLPQAVSTEEKESYRMSAIQNLHSFGSGATAWALGLAPERDRKERAGDPFADASKGDDLLPAGTEDYIHIRIQQRNGRKTLTTVQGIADDYDKKKLVKAFKKKFACNGTVIEHPEYGEVIQLQGDQRKNICQFLVEIGLAKDDQLKVHGF
ncbi:hypothetical protein J1605_023330 [Eschrichtius robustus]|uniref:SUI1 domain-containing protein n=2 Tax=Boreoeutheria TaxID=1437010 RepID=A0AB34H675_ESCRO|nr:hypothetical protein J1605_023330 [Eschrichtius robustus]